ncbi:serine/threonine-protein kinase [Streptomyces sp. NPDC016309]|uniref:serine/threonine-protein kinase n=1 Tax=Streptomyces sp. NPDC016309 TaxID=3364965 RepID=UPI0036FD63A2
MSMSESGRPLVDARFELVSRLGSGGMGTVWRARDVALDREVALKEVRPPDPAVEEANPGLAAQMRERAVREARALARLSNPHVVTIHHIVEPADGSHPWIVMELVEGRSVYDRLLEGPMPVPEVVRLGLEVLSALRAAHSAGIHHRDVKPANVLLRPDGGAVLTDFGIAALSEATSRLTSTGDLIGSPEFIAPERVRGEEGNPASDLWSLGMLLYVAAEGHHPFRRATSLATVVAVLDDPLPPPVRSGALTPVLERLLVRDPARRPDGAGLELLLREAAGRAGTAAPADAAPEDSRPADRPAGPAHPHAPFPPAGPPTAPGHAPHPGADPGPYGPYPGYAGPGAHHPTGTPHGTPPHGTFGPPVAPTRRPAGRRAAVVSLAAAATATVVVAAALNWPLGKDAADEGKSPTPSSSSARRTPVADTGGTTPGTGTPAGTGTGNGSGTGGARTTGTLLTPANVRTVLAAFREASGNQQVKEVTVYENYAMADIPTKPGAKTYDSYRYSDGIATRTGPGGTIDPDSPDDQTFDPAAVAWDTLPALIRRGEKELNVENPNLRYLVLHRWTFNADQPTLHFYLTNEYMASGYLATDVRGKVVSSHPAS